MRPRTCVLPELTWYNQHYKQCFAKGSGVSNVWAHLHTASPSPPDLPVQRPPAVAALASLW